MPETSLKDNKLATPKPLNWSAKSRYVDWLDSSVISSQTVNILLELIKRGLNIDVKRKQELFHPNILTSGKNNFSSTNSLK